MTEPDQAIPAADVLAAINSAMPPEPLRMPGATGDPVGSVPAQPATTTVPTSTVSPTTTSGDDSGGGGKGRSHPEDD